MSHEQQEITTVVTTIGNPQDDLRLFNTNDQGSSMNRKECVATTSEEDEIDFYEENDETKSLLVSSDITHTVKASKGFSNRQNFRSDFASMLRPDMRIQAFEIDNCKKGGKYGEKEIVCNNEKKDEYVEDTNCVVGSIPSQFLCNLIARCCCLHRNFKSTLKCMNNIAKLVLWATAVALIVAVIWYSYELHNHG
jgi:hypothetical protein